MGTADAAECLIKSLMPDSEERTKLIDEALNEIVKESLRPEDRKLLADALARAAKPESKLPGGDG